ncbi:MAG: DUF4919 domain-containing protein, partial [Muribaculaceae bacterium]|nr:DUF4919 domain-containing protein [Muribaculaceae bacterium]
MLKISSFIKRSIPLIVAVVLAVPAYRSVAQTSVPTADASSKRKIVVEKPDLEKIKKETLDPASPFYFPKLMAKYTRNDTTMTNEE